MVGLGVARDEAKHLFLRLLYGGSAAKWQRELGLETLPAFEPSPSAMPSSIGESWRPSSARDLPGLSFGCKAT